MVYTDLHGIEYVVKFKNEVDWFEIVPDVMKQTKHFIDIKRYSKNKLIVIELDYGTEAMEKRFSEDIRNNKFFNIKYFYNSDIDYDTKQNKESINLLLNQEEKQESRLTDKEKAVVNYLLNHPVALDNVEFHGWETVSLVV